MKQPFFERLLVVDGAMGTQLQHLLSAGEVPEMLNLTNPQAVQDVHRRYLASGADMVLTNSFGANRTRLAQFGLEGRLEELNRAAVQNARVAGAHLVAGSVGPTGEMSAPLGSYGFDDFYQAFAPQVKVLSEAGVDAIAIETMMDVIELKAAVAAVRDIAKEIPLIAQVSLLNGRTLNGTDLPAVAVMLDAMGVDVIGLNCVSLTEELAEILAATAEVTDKRLIVQPNAGMPDQTGSHHLDLTEWRRIMRIIVQTPGVGVVGGCCGTNPEAIAILREMVDELQGPRKAWEVQESLGEISEVKADSPGERELINDVGEEVKATFPCKKGEGRLPQLSNFTEESKRTIVENDNIIPEKTHLSSRTGVFTLDQHRCPYVIGERINPSGRADLQQALTSGDWFTVGDEGVAQGEAGAELLDVNVGMAGIDQAQAMAEVVQQLQLRTNCPLVLDSPDPRVLEAGLKVYIGKPIINSCTGATASLAKVLPLARKYGAAVIGLCMDEGGIPATVEERVAVGRKIVQAAEAYGIAKADLFLDPLVLSAVTGEGVSATLQTLREIKRQLGVKTVAGVSNVSFGLPGREIINRTMLAMAVGAGLDLAIVNPCDQGIIQTVKAGQLLLGHDPDCMEYVAFYRGGFA